MKLSKIKGNFKNWNGRLAQLALFSKIKVWKIKGADCEKEKKLRIFIKKVEIGEKKNNKWGNLFLGTSKEFKIKKV